MTEMPDEQRYEWFENTREGNAAKRDWMAKKHKEGFHVTIIFNDPTDDKFLIVTNQAKNLSEYLCPVSFPLKNAGKRL